MILDRSRRFKKSFRKLPIEMKRMFFIKLDIFVINRNHPSLRVKKMLNHDCIYEASINMQYRFTFEDITGGILLRNIGNHDDVLDNP
jgi:hypothetical protein